MLTLSSLVGSVGLLAPLTLLVAFKGWLLHAGGPWSAGGLLVVSSFLLWRVVPAAWRGRADAAQPPHPLGASLCRHYRAVQSAWDAQDGARLQGLTTAPMLAELRDQQGGFVGERRRTEVVSVQVQVLAHERAGRADLVCAEFTGWVRERTADPVPFRELWMLERESDSTGWKLARQLTLS